MHTILGHPSTEQQETPEANLFKKVDCLIKLVNSMHQLLKSVIPGTGEWVTGGGNAGPDGFVPAVPSDPYEILAYVGFPADSVESKLLTY